MKVTGYTLKYAIASQRRKVEILFSKFEQNSKKFPSEHKEDIRTISADIEKAEARVAKLQSYLTEYNLGVKFSFMGETINILEAVRRVGSAGRLEKKWRSLVEVKQERYGFRNNTREQNTEYETLALDFDECVKQHEASERRAVKLREAIDKANATEIELQGVEELL